MDPQLALRNAGLFLMSKSDELNTVQGIGARMYLQGIQSRLRYCSSKPSLSQVVELAAFRVATEATRASLSDANLKGTPYMHSRYLRLDIRTQKPLQVDRRQLPGP